MLFFIQHFTFVLIRPAHLSLLIVGFNITVNGKRAHVLTSQHATETVYWKALIKPIKISISILLKHLRLYDKTQLVSKFHS